MCTPSSVCLGSAAHARPFLSCSAPRHSCWTICLQGHPSFPVRFWPYTSSPLVWTAFSLATGSDDPGKAAPLIGHPPYSSFWSGSYIPMPGHPFPPPFGSGSLGHSPVWINSSPALSVDVHPRLPFCRDTLLSPLGFHMLHDMHLPRPRIAPSSPCWGLPSSASWNGLKIELFRAEGSERGARRGTNFKSFIDE